MSTKFCPISRKSLAIAVARIARGDADEGINKALVSYNEFFHGRTKRRPFLHANGGAIIAPMCEELVTPLVMRERVMPRLPLAFNVIHKNMGEYVTAIVMTCGDENVREAEAYRIKNGKASPVSNPVRSRSYQALLESRWTKSRIGSIPTLATLRLTRATVRQFVGSRAA